MGRVKCGECKWCIRDGFRPYCVLKDFYTFVRLENECDEKDFKGNCYFEEVKNEDAGGD